MGTLSGIGVPMRKNAKPGEQYRKNLTLPPEVRRRAEAVAEADRRKVVEVLRLAVEHGLDLLEDRLGIRKTRK